MTESRLIFQLFFSREISFSSVNLFHQIFVYKLIIAQETPVKMKKMLIIDQCFSLRDNDRKQPCISPSLIQGCFPKEIYE